MKQAQTWDEVEGVGAAEDSQDIAILAATAERERAVGVDIARRDYLASDLVARMPADEHPVRLWRDSGISL